MQRKNPEKCREKGEHYIFLHLKADITGTPNKTPPGIRYWFGLSIDFVLLFEVFRRYSEHVR